MPFLPVLTLSITGVANIALHTREKMVDVLESDYVLFARARGESGLSIVMRHGLRNVVLPAITLQFASVSEIIGGSVLVEQVFSYPGLGQAAVTAGLGSDLPLLLGITVITSAIVFGGNLIADLPLRRSGSQNTEGGGKKMREKNRRKSSAPVSDSSCIDSGSGDCGRNSAGRGGGRKQILPEKIFLHLHPGCSARTGWGGTCWPEPLRALSLSIRIGVLTAGVSAAAALILGNRRSHVGKESRRGDFLVY